MGEDTRPQDDDEAAIARAEERLTKNRECQLVARLVAELRGRHRPWWRAVDLRRVWPTQTRFQWLDGRPDVRGRITHQLTGLPAVTARESDRPFQAELIERVLDSSAVTADDWELSFEPEEIATHAPPHVIWGEFRRRFPWDDPDVEDKDLLAWLLGDLLDEKKDGGREPPTMTALYVRSAIDLRAWQEHMPLDVRILVDQRRLRKELEGKTFSCRDELAVVKLDRVVDHIPAVHLRAVLDALERVVPALGGPVEGDEEAEHTETVAKPDVEAH